MNRMLHSSDAIVVLTTEERFGLFAPVVGTGADARFDPGQTRPLHDFLVNCASSGAQLVILDEAHFIKVEDMVDGLQEYLDDPDVPATSLGIIVVCSGRGPGDKLLSYLATYCGVYDIVYGVEGAELSAALGALLRRPNTRRDVLELVCGQTSLHRRTRDHIVDVQVPAVSALKGEEISPVGDSGGDAAHRIKINVKIEI